MEILQQAGTFILWLVVLPFFCGVLPTHLIERNQKTLGTMFLSGWCVMAAIFQLLAVPFVLNQIYLSKLSLVFSVIIYVLAMAGLIFVIIGVIRDGANEFFEFGEWTYMLRKDWIAWAVFGALLLFQLFMSVFMMSTDGDDAYYVTQAVLAAQTDRMYIFNPYTKGFWDMDARHVLAPFSMFYAMLAQKSGVHATIVAHTVMPLILIPLTYLVYYKIGVLLFKEEKKKLSTFMILLVGVQLFGNTSLYTNETFFLTRTWQGKSILGNVALPAIFLIMFSLSRLTEKGEKISKRQMIGLFLMLISTNIMGSLVSSLGLLLMSVSELVFGILITVRNRRLWVILGTIITMIPSGIYMMIYYYF